MLRYGFVNHDVNVCISIVFLKSTSLLGRYNHIGTADYKRPYMHSETKKKESNGKRKKENKVIYEQPCKHNTFFLCQRGGVSPPELYSKSGRPQINGLVFLSIKE